MYAVHLISYIQIQIEALLLDKYYCDDNDDDDYYDAHVKHDVSLASFITDR